MKHKWTRMDQDTYDNLINGAEIICKDAHGYKVIKLQDGQIAKLFRLKRIISSAILFPYALRFVKGAEILQNLKIPTVQVTALCKVPSIKRDLVIYQPLEGEAITSVIKQSSDPQEIIGGFAKFLALLHEKGIYFRAVHFGNVIITPQGDFGLIDLSELYAYKSPLSLSKRVRNFKPIMRYKDDKNALTSFSIDHFVDLYLQNSTLKTKKQVIKLQHGVKKLFTDRNPK